MASFNFTGSLQPETSPVSSMVTGGKQDSKKTSISRSASPTPTKLPTPAVPASVPIKVPFGTFSSSTTTTGARDRRISNTMTLELGILLLQIRVGKDTQERLFHVHETPLKSRSEFFKLAASGSSPMVLKDEDPDTFALYITLVYSGSIATRGADEWLKLVRLYVLAEKLQDTKAKNSVMDAMHGFMKEVFPKEPSPDSAAHGRELRLMSAESIAELYEGTTPGSLARKLVLDLYADNGRENWLKAGEEKLPKSFLFELAVTMVKKRPFSLSGSMLNRPSSHYHEFEVKSSPNPGQIDGEGSDGDATTIAMKSRPDESDFTVVEDTQTP